MHICIYEIYYNQNVKEPYDKAVPVQCETSHQLCYVCSASPRGSTWRVLLGRVKLLVGIVWYC